MDDLEEFLLDEVLLSLNGGEKVATQPFTVGKSSLRN